MKLLIYLWDKMVQFFIEKHLARRAIKMFKAFEAIILEHEKSRMPEKVNYSILRVMCVYVCTCVYICACVFECVYVCLRTTAMSHSGGRMRK